MNKRFERTVMLDIYKERSKCTDAGLPFLGKDYDAHYTDRLWDKWFYTEDHCKDSPKENVFASAVMERRF